jgi:hypothetical protein
MTRAPRSNARVVRDLAVFERDVEIHADEDALVLDRQLADRENAFEVVRAGAGHDGCGSEAQSFEETSCESSIIRFEKPHSLSYQEKTLANLSPMTWVIVASKIDERGSLM